MPTRQTHGVPVLAWGSRSGVGCRCTHGVPPHTGGIHRVSPHPWGNRQSIGYPETSSREKCAFLHSYLGCTPSGPH